MFVQCEETSQLSFRTQRSSTSLIRHIKKLVLDGATQPCDLPTHQLLRLTHAKEIFAWAIIWKILM